MQVVTLPLKTKFETSHNTTLENILQAWHWQLAFDYPERSVASRDSIVNWLIGNHFEQIEQLDAEQIQLIQQGMAYRYRILQNRYLGQTPEQGHRLLVTRLGSLVVLQNKIRMLVALSRDRRRQVTEVLQEFLQDLLQRLLLHHQM